MKVLVTGATGFIGERYALHLAEREGVEVFACGRNRQKSGRLEIRGIHFFCGDLLDKPFVDHICQQVDIVVHAAGLSGIWGDYRPYYAANVVATENLLAASRKSGTSRFVYIGSPSIYFDYKDHINISEDYLPVRFVDNYARTKYQGEMRVLAAHNDQFGAVSLRPRLVIGAADVNFLPRIIRLHQEGKLRVIGHGRNVVSVTSIGNLLHALDRCVFGSETALGTAYNIADPEPVRIWEMIDQLMALLDLPAVTNRAPYWPLASIAAAIEQSYRALKKPQEPPLMRIKVAALAKSFTLNIEKATRQLEYRPRNLLKESLTEFAECWRMQKEVTREPVS
ncbi:MAG: NAD(P)-dependent oxidoreductase [Ketobacteraceae bacterium]|nr:NAD(P)-dependent oxidoreductase [Ketobacteraceae bacterium]